MLEKQKEWCKENMEKGIEWIKKNKASIAFGLGMAAMAGGYLIAEKIEEPKKAAICFTRNLNTAHTMGNVFYKNRFGKERHLLRIDYGIDKESNESLKMLCDELNEVVYPGD